MINVPSFTKVFRVLVVWTLLLTTPSVFAAVNENDKAKAQELLAKAIVGFEENKGQFIDQTID
ncbi:MAG: hypothetical protein J0M25_13685 [Flavobacteriales bacterium]|nr:hypothetical protein [Flavobacteriales bacterium]